MLGWELPPHHTGGLGVVCYQMCKQLAVSGVDIEFILPFSATFAIDFMKVTPAHPQSVESVSKAGGVYESEKYDLHFKNGSSTTLDMRGQQKMFRDNVAKLALQREFDILHAHDWLTFRAAMAAKVVSGKPLIVHIHSTEFDRAGGGYGNPMVHEIEYAGMMMADQVFAVSQHTKNVICREYGIPAHKVAVVHNSMEVTEDIDESYNLHRYRVRMKQLGYRVVVNCGRLTIQKGLAQLLLAAKKVVDVNPKVLFLIAGGGEQLHELIALAAEYGISENVIFTGYLNGTGKQWRDSFRVGDVFVMPSVSEPFGVAALEAIGYGVPVIVSKQSGVGELLANALKVDFWDTDGMADQILSVVEHQGLHDELLKNAQNEYRRLSWKDSASAMHDHYRAHLAGAVA